MNKELKLGSLFDGSGGFPLAGTMCGFEPCWAAEVEPYPIAVTRSRFPKMKHLGDITKVNGAEIEPVDIITFGSPCQDLSVAGKRAGLKHEANGDDETTRSGLFMEAVRIVKEMREETNGVYPTFVVWENVHGAFSSNNGEDFRIVLEEIIKIVEPTATMPQVPKGGWAYADSYVGDGWSLAYRVFDAQYWGVPQRRRRIYLVADFRGERAREVLFEREGLRGYFATGRTPWQTTPTDAQGGSVADDREGHCITLLFENHSQDARYKGPLDVCPMLSAQLGTGGNNQPLVMEPFCKSARPRSADDATTWVPGRVANTLNTFDLGETRANELVVMATQQGGAEISESGICPTITDAAGMSGNNQPVICLQGTAPTLCTTHGGEPAVAYKEVFRQGGFADYVEGEVGTLKASGGDLGGGSENLVAAYVDTTHADDVVRMDDITAPLQARDYKGGKLISTNYIVRRLTPTECARLQGFADWWSYVEAIDTFSQKDYQFWLKVRKTHDAINGRKPKDYTVKQMLSWYNKLWTDSSEYKMWGNGIALPCALYVMQGIADALATHISNDKN